MEVERNIDTHVNAKNRNERISGVGVRQQNLVNWRRFQSMTIDSVDDIAGGVSEVVGMLFGEEKINGNRKSWRANGGIRRISHKQLSFQFSPVLVANYGYISLLFFYNLWLQMTNDQTRINLIFPLTQPMKISNVIYTSRHRVKVTNFILNLTSCKR